MAAPCNWNVDPMALGACSTWNDYPVETQDAALALASSFLWGATGRRYGVCPVVVRPNQRSAGEVLYQTFEASVGRDGMGVPGGPFLFSGRWFNAGCASACCGNRACAVVLRGPVFDVDEVLVGAEVVPASAYRVDITGGVYLLIRIDGECWPVCQDFTAEPGEAGAFEVTYGMGRPVPTALAYAAALLACEYGRYLTAGSCKLPAKMTRLSRQGVEVELEAPASDGEKTGIREVDNVIFTLNPSGLKSPPLLLSPDLPENCDRMTVVQAGS